MIKRFIDDFNKRMEFNTVKDVTSPSLIVRENNVKIPKTSDYKNTNTHKQIKSDVNCTSHI